MGGMVTIPLLLKIMEIVSLNAFGGNVRSTVSDGPARCRFGFIDYFKLDFVNSRLEF